jgi:hypothetical protein
MGKKSSLLRNELLRQRFNASVKFIFNSTYVIIKHRWFNGGLNLEQAQLIAKLKIIKRKYEPEGLIIIGFFGSYARGEQNTNSDIDILYELKDSAIEKYPGFRFIVLYENVKADLEKEMGVKIDLAEKSSLNNIGLKYILPEVHYVT